MTAPEPGPYRELAERIVFESQWTMSREASAYYLSTIEAALSTSQADLVNQIAAKDEEIFRLNRALSYANTLNEDLLKEIRTLREGICQAQDEEYFGRHRKP